MAYFRGYFRSSKAQRNALFPRICPEILVRANVSPSAHRDLLVRAPNPKGSFANSSCSSSSSGWHARESTCASTLHRLSQACAHVQAQNWSGQASQHTRQSAEPARTTGPLSGADVEDRIDQAHEPHRTRAASLLPEAVMATTARAPITRCWALPPRRGFAVSRVG